MEGIMIGSVSIINPKLVTGPNSTSIIETKVPTPTVMERMLVTAVTPLQALNHHLKIKVEKKNQDSKRKNRSKKLIIQKPIDRTVMMSHITGIEDKYKLSNREAYRIKIMNHSSKIAPLGPINEPIRPQKNMMKVIQLVDEGSQVDFLA